MKLLRTVSIVVVLIGIFTWFFAPLISSVSFQSSDGIPAASLVIYSDSDHSLYKSTPLYWMSIASILLLGAGLLFIVFKSFWGVGICSATALVALIFGGNQVQAILGNIVSYLVGLSVSYYLLIGVFAVLLTLSILSLLKPRDVSQAIILVLIIVAGAVWFTAPFISFDVYQGGEAISASSLLSSDGLEYFPTLKEAWHATPFYWMPFASIILLGGCLLFSCFKQFYGVCLCSLAAIATLVVGNTLSSPLKLVHMHLGIGYYLLMGLFIVLICFGAIHLAQTKQEQKKNKKADDATA